MIEMEAINKVITELEELIETVPQQLQQFTQEELSHKPNSGKWSNKEILGHLCDSCLNNIQRVIRVQYEDKPFIIYKQDEWVKIQGYQARSIDEIVGLWETLHLQFIRLLKAFPENKLGSLVDMGEEVTARFVISDYLRHQNHHLKQIFG